MSSSFLRSQQSVGSDSSRRPVTILLVATSLLGSWFAWAVLARVSVYKVSDAARLEVIQAEHLIATPVAGMVIATNLQIGRDVKVGDILVRLDAKCQRLQLEEQRARQAALVAQLEVMRREVAMQEQAILHDNQAAKAALDEARADYRGAQSTAEVDKETAAHYARLEAGYAAELERRRFAAQSRKSQAESESAGLAVEKLAADIETRKRDRGAFVERQRVEIVKAEGESTTTAAMIKRLEYESDRRTVRAAVTGRVGKVSALRVGSFVTEGQSLGAIVPPGQVQIVADFPPGAALGRIRRGQSARLRLDGFPWSQYGSVDGTVARVGSAVHKGRVRVELTVAPGSNPLIQLEHGLPGTLEVEVERVSPMTLLLRAAGRRLARPTPVRFADASHIG